MPRLIPNKLPAGSILHLLPDTIKNKKGGHCVVTLTCDILCWFTWLQLAVHHYAAAGQPVTNFLTRPLQVGTKLYAEKGMTCRSAWAQLTKYLKVLRHDGSHDGTLACSHLNMFTMDKYFAYEKLSDVSQFLQQGD